MAYIFMDESGDMGFDEHAKGSSRFFVMTFLFIEEKRAFEKIIRNAHSAIRKNYKMRSGTLHAAHERPETIIRVLKRLAEKKSCKIMAIYLNKKKVYTGIEESKHTLYNMVTNILLDRIMTKRLVSRDERIYFIASRRETKKALNENFKAYLMTNVQARHAIDMDISIKAPDQEKCLQLADIVSWAIARKYELRDERYYEIIKDLIIEESPLIP